MPWVSIGASVAGSAVSGLLGSSSAKKASKEANKIAREQMNMIANQQNRASNNLQPFVDTGDAANQRLADLLGISSPKGYDPRPTRDNIYNQYLSEHYQKYGRNLETGSDIGDFNNQVDLRYNAALKNWEQGLANYQPQSGDYASDYGSLLKPFTNEDFLKDPGYDFRMAEGEKGLNRAFASRGGYDSGAALKAINRYNQDYASNEFSNAYNRDSNNKSMTYNFLSGTSGAGQNAAATLGGLGANAVNAQANALGQGSQQAAQYQMQGANAINNAIQGGLANSLYALRTAQTAPVYGSGGSIYGSGGSSSLPPWYLS